MDMLCHTEPELEAVVSDNEIILPHSAISLDNCFVNCLPTYDTIYLAEFMWVRRGIQGMDGMCIHAADWVRKDEKQKIITNTMVETFSLLCVYKSWPTHSSRWKSAVKYRHFLVSRHQKKI